MVEELRSIEDRVTAIEKRNARVESDKAWEVSLTRKAAVAVLTYIFAYIYFAVIGEEKRLILAFVPAGAYIISVLSLQRLRQIWQRKNRLEN